MQNKKFVVGDLIYVKDCNGEYTGYIFLAECNDYYVCCSEYYGYDLKEQLEQMWEESLDGSSPDIYVFRKSDCKEDAE